MKKLFFQVALAALAGSVQAQTIEVTSPESWNLYRGTAIEQRGFPTKAACQAAAPQDLSRRCVGSVTFIRRADQPPPTCSPAPVPQTQQAACPTGTTGSFTQTRTATVGAPPTCAINWSQWTPPTPPSGACPAEPPPPPPPPVANALYFSDCQAGAAAGCMPGNDANPGTLAAPKRVPTSALINAAPAGTQFLLARGGVWSMGAILEFHNLNATPASPIVMDAYGTGADPVLRYTATIGLQFGGRWANQTNDGGYTVRNVVLQAPTSDGDTRGVWVVQNARNITLENVTVTGWRTGLQVQPDAPFGVSFFTLRNSRVIGSRSFGMLYAGNDGLIEGNHFEGNNPGGSAMLHALYMNGAGARNTVRGNRFVRNSVVNGVCTGGNFTLHGSQDGLLIENNLIDQASGNDQCGGFNLTAAYPEVEAFRNVVIRGNTAVNVGPGAVIVDSAPGVVIEGNRSINATGRSHTLAWTYQNGDTPTTGAIVRDNILCGAGAITNIAGATQSGNRTLALTDAACAR